MSDLRTAAQQALEALEYAQQDRECPSTTRQAIAALRAALAQQAEPTDPGNDVDVLREHVRHLERRVRELHAQQAEPVAGVVLNEEGRAALVEYGREEWHCVTRNARRLYTAPPKDKPKPMHPELRKMWEDYFDKCFRAMPVPKQAEPVGWNWMLDGQPYGQAYYGNPPDTDIAERAAIAGRTVRLLYTAPPPPQRKPLTEEVAALIAQRDALLEVLKLARSIIGHPDDAHSQMIDAVIKAVEEGK